jgi:hypothetical protein
VTSSGAFGVRWYRSGVAEISAWLGIVNNADVRSAAEAESVGDGGKLGIFAMPLFIESVHVTIWGCSIRFWPSTYFDRSPNSERTMLHLPLW